MSASNEERRFAPGVGGPLRTRRRILRGVGGATLALPFLEYDLRGPRRAWAAPVPKLIVCYSGQAMGGDGDRTTHRFRPAMPGRLADQTLPLSLEPLGGRERWSGRYRHPRRGEIVAPVRNWPGEVADVRDRVTVVTGLRVPLNQGPAPAESYHHRGTVSPVLSGTRGRGTSAACGGPTADVIAEEAWRAPPTLRCLVQAGNYGNGGSLDSTMSWQVRNGTLTGIRAQVSPRATWNALFGGFQPPAPGRDDALVERQRAQRRRQGILDLVLPATRELHGRLGGADRQRLEAHLDGLRTLDERIRELELAGNDQPGLSACAVPADPGEDPRYTGGRGGDGGGFAAGEGWSAEEKRAEAFVELVTMALACNLARTATIMFSYHQSFLNGEVPTGLRGDQHQIGHGGPVERANGSPNDSVALCHHFPVRYFGLLVERLSRTASGPDRSLLDDVAMALLWEAGHGMYEGNMSAHSGDEMCALVAGRAGGLRNGEHVRLPGEHPARVLTTLLGAVGLSPRLGALSGTLPGLLP